MDKTSSVPLAKQLSNGHDGTRHTAEGTPMNDTSVTHARSVPAQVLPPVTATGPAPTLSFEHLPVYQASIRGGGCASFTCCDDPGSACFHGNAADLNTDKVDHVLDSEDTRPPAWQGWAELENDPDIFTILLQEWGVPTLSVHEILDVLEMVTTADPPDVLGLIFLSQYAPSEHSEPVTAGVTSDGKDIPEPWFANQISKFSCGSVALVNILMNAQNLSLSETLSSFKQNTINLNAKSRGIALDNHAHIRDTHNSFSTKLDRMIVDVMVKEEAQKHKQGKVQEARQSQPAGKKRKRRGARFTKTRKKRNTLEDDEEAGFHFVAYVSANNYVWKLDGMLTHPQCVGPIRADQTWLNVAAEDLIQKMGDALQSGQECSLMSVTRSASDVPLDDAKLQAQKLEAERKQEDWAPFIEHMLRLHAEKGDLLERFISHY